MADKPIPCPALLRQLLRYEPETGRLFWLPRPVELFANKRTWKIWNKRYAEKEAFTYVSNGYKTGRIFDRPHFAHRVAWAIAYGESPVMEIDHIDGDRANNRLANLRHVSGADNQRNKSLNKNNASGFLGVCWDKGRGQWMARISHEGRAVPLGRFDNKDDAISARSAALVQYGYHPNHGRD